MFTISLHHIKINAPIGLYPQEALLSNNFEVDIDVDVKDYSEKHFVDYVVINEIVQKSFITKEKILEQLALNIYKAIYDQFSFTQRVKVCIRKYNPPMKGAVGFSQVVFEK
jgi:7,8-dihydroneopterin aldolase/epimerase/oxygenase